MAFCSVHERVVHLHEKESFLLSMVVSSGYKIMSGKQTSRYFPVLMQAGRVAHFPNSYVRENKIFLEESSLLFPLNNTMRESTIMKYSWQKVEIDWRLPAGSDCANPSARRRSNHSRTFSLFSTGRITWMVSTALCLGLLFGDLFFFASGYVPLSQKRRPCVRKKKRHTGVLLAALVESTTGEQQKVPNAKRRFSKAASSNIKLDEPCVLTIGKEQYDLTPWAKAHPGGISVLQKFHGKNATVAFDAVGHSEKAYALLQKLRVVSHAVTTLSGDDERDSRHATSVNAASLPSRQMPLWRKKLFTHEDPIGLHKYLGIFVLLHFAFRFRQLLFGDPSAGFGIRMGLGASRTAALWLVPHAILNLSSFIFHTVPRERVIGKPMIWKEYRVHNIIFAMRSIASSFLCWVSVYFQHAAPWRRLAVVGCSLSVLAANWAADEATRRLRPSEFDSSVASLPFWDGCSADMERRVKKFYAYCQFMATIACLMVSNPAWPFAVLMPIQMSSILLTLVRKGLISARGFHIGYVASLVLPFFMGLRHFFIMRTVDIPAAILYGAGLFYLRGRGVNKYALWIPTVALRIAVGDRLMHWNFLW